MQFWSATVKYIVKFIYIYIYIYIYMELTSTDCDIKFNARRVIWECKLLLDANIQLYYSKNTTVNQERVHTFSDLVNGIVFSVLLLCFLICCCVFCCVVVICTSGPPYQGGYNPINENVKSSAKHRYLETWNVFMLQLYVSWVYIFILTLRQCCAPGLVRFRQTNCLVGVRKRLGF